MRGVWVFVLLLGGCSTTLVPKEGLNYVFANPLCIAFCSGSLSGALAESAGSTNISQSSNTSTTGNE